MILIGAGCALSAALVAYGLFVAWSAAQRVSRHALALAESAANAVDPERGLVALDRIEGSLNGVASLLERCTRALTTIQGGLDDLRVPEAVAGLRIAGAAIRLLSTGR